MPDPLAVTATFLSPPSSGPAEITVAIAKRGRRSSVAEVVLHQDGRDHVRATAVLGDLDGLDGPSSRAAVVVGSSPRAVRVDRGPAGAERDRRRPRSSVTSTSAWPPTSVG